MRITLKGKAKENEVRTILGEEASKIFGSDKWVGGYSRTLLPYIIHYIQEHITKDELVNVLIHHYEIENLHMTYLMGIIDEHEQEWKKWAQNPNTWYAYYYKDIDDQTKEVTIFPATNSDMPDQDMYDSELLGKQMGLKRQMLEESQETNRILANVQSQLHDFNRKGR